MDLITFPTEIVNKIFNFLDPYDVYNCKCVCSAWNLEANRWLSRCQAIETFSFSKIKASLPCKLIDGIAVDESEEYPEHFGIMLELLVSNRVMNEDAIDQVFLKRRPFEIYWNHLYWCYYKEKNKYHHIIRPNFGRYIEKSLANGQRDYLFSFVTFDNIDHYFKSLVEPIYESIPFAGLMIEQDLNEFDLGDEILDFDRSSFEKISKAPDPFKYKLSTWKELNSFNINQWTTKTKIILTNWESEHGLSREGLYDPDYPIKSLICFKTIPFSCESLEFFLKNEDVIASDVVLDCLSKMCIKPGEWYEKNNPRIVSIAFAGENVKAATLSIESLDSTTRAQQLKTFRQSLDFSVDDGRIVGFIFIGDLFKGNVRSEIFISIHKTFPDVNFMDISCWEPEDSPTAEQGLIEGIRIHLIHL